MSAIFDLFSLNKHRKNGLKLRKSETGEWTVKKGHSVLYIGTKEKCEFFMNQGQIA